MIFTPGSKEAMLAEKRARHKEVTKRIALHCSGTMCVPYYYFLRKDGSIKTNSTDKESTSEITSWRNVIDFSVDDDYIWTNFVALKKDGTLYHYCREEDVVGHTRLKWNVSSWRNIVKISNSSFHLVGVRADGTVVATGENKDGRCDVEGWRDIAEVFTSPRHTIGLRADGRVVACGLNEHGQCNVSDWTDIVDICCGNFYTIGLRADGRVVACGLNESGILDVTDWRDVFAITCSHCHTVGITVDHKLVACGDVWLDTIGNDPKGRAVFPYYKDSAVKLFVRDAEKKMTDVIGVVPGFTVGLAGIKKSHTYTNAVTSDGKLIESCWDKYSTLIEKVVRFDGHYSELPNGDVVTSRSKEILFNANTTLAKETEEAEAEECKKRKITLDQLKREKKEKEEDEIALKHHIKDARVRSAEIAARFTLLKNGFIYRDTNGKSHAVGFSSKANAELSTWDDVEIIVSGRYNYKKEYFIGIRKDGTLRTFGLKRKAAKALATWTDIETICCYEKMIIAARRSETDERNVIGFGISPSEMSVLQTWKNVNRLHFFYGCKIVAQGRHGEVYATGRNTLRANIITSRKDHRWLYSDYDNIIGEYGDGHYKICGSCKYPEEDDIKFIKKHKPLKTEVFADALAVLCQDNMLWIGNYSIDYGSIAVREHIRENIIDIATCQNMLMILNADDTISIASSFLNNDHLMQAKKCGKVVALVGCLDYVLAVKCDGTVSTFGRGSINYSEDVKKFRVEDIN